MSTTLLKDLALACRKLSSDSQIALPNRSVLPGLPLWMEGLGVVWHDKRHYWADNRDRWVLHLCLGGGGFVRTHGKVTVIKAPSILVLEPGVMHTHWSNPADPWILFHWFLRNDGEINTRVLREMGLNREVISLNPSENDSRAKPPNYSHLLPLLDAVEALIKCKGEEPLDVYRRYAQMFAFHVTLSKCAGISPIWREKTELLERAEKILLHLHDPGLNAKTLADSLSVNRSTLTRAFRKAGLPPPGEMITERRMQQARKLLEAEPDLSLKQVATACGYRDAAYFCRCFALHHKVSPMRFRKESNKSLV